MGGGRAAGESAKPLRRPRGRRRRAKGPALCVLGRRNGVRPGAAQRPLFARPHRAHLRFAAHLRPPGAALQAEASRRRRHARGLGRLSHLHFPDPARHLLRRRPGVQRQAPRARRRGLRLQPEAHLRPEAEGAFAIRTSRTKASSACRSCTTPPPRARSRSTTTPGSKVCRRSTATRCACGCANRGRAISSPGRRATSTARWRAKSSRSTATTSWRIRWAPGRSG